jgi:hypothetical protein
MNCTLHLAWGDASLLEQAVYECLARWQQTYQEPSQRKLTPLQVLALRPLRSFCQRAARRRHSEQHASLPRKKRAAPWRLTLPLDEVLALLECCRPTREDWHHAAFMRVHQAAQSWSQFVQIQ